MRSRGGLTPRSTLFLAPALGLVACGDDASGKHWSALATCLAGPAASAPVAERGVIMPSGTQGLATDVIGKIEAWQRCGSPNN